MQTATESFYKQKLLVRRRRLEEATAESTPSRELLELLEAVDSALSRLERGEFGLCEVCHDPIEEDRLAADPLTRVCIDHLNPAQRRALEDDLALAARVQRRLLPGRELELASWHIALHFEPAGPVSGDYCDLVRSDADGGFYFFLGDISGKGVSASLLMSHLHAVFRSLISTDLPLDRLMSQANHLFCENTISSHYATLVAGRARQTGAVELTSAGHCPVLAMRNGRAAQIGSTGLPIGLFSEAEYSVKKVELAAGDSLVLFSDGVIEACNSSQQEYGVDRLAQLVARHSSRRPIELVQTFRDDFNAFRSERPRHDDVALMVVQRTGKAKQ